MPNDIVLCHYMRGDEEYVVFVDGEDPEDFTEPGFTLVGTYDLEPREGTRGPHMLPCNTQLEG